MYMYNLYEHTTQHNFYLYPSYYTGMLVALKFLKIPKYFHLP